MAKPPAGVVEIDDHAYNDPDIDPREFLLAVMRDKRLPIAVRTDAATKVAVYMHPRLAQVNQEIVGGVTIRIEGGLPALPGTNIIMPAPSIPAKAPVTNGHDE